MKTYQQYRNAIIGKAFDVDGAPAGDPVQCVDIIKKFHYDELGMKAYALGGSGYAREYWHRFEALGLGKFYKKVSLSQCKVGDIIVFEKGAQDAPVSHVGFVDALPANGRVNVLGQNQPQKYVNVVSFSTNGVLGCLRLNAWDKVESTGLKYGVGTPVTVTGVWTSSTGGKYVASSGLVYGKGTYYIVDTHPDTIHPYALSNTPNGSIVGFVADKEIDEEPSVPGGKPASKPDQILEVGSLVTSVPMKLAIPKGEKYAVKKVNGVECGYLPELGGWFPLKYLSEHDASDGKKDNYFATIAAKAVLDQCTVEKVDARSNLVMIHGIWVDPTPLTELKNGK